MTRQQEGAYVLLRISVFRTDDLKGNFVLSLFVLALLLIFIWHAFGLYPIAYVWLFLLFCLLSIYLLLIFMEQELLFAFALCMFLCLVCS